MHLYTNFFGLKIPSYGLCIAAGLVLANIVAVIIIKRNKLDFNDFIILEAYCLLGAFTGAKALYLIVSREYIDWSRISDFNYFNELILGGFVFYGGFIGGFLFAYIAGIAHKIAAGTYIRKLIFLIPFMHAFGRIGCFMAGCCYGIPYHGVGAVVFPEGSYAPAGVELFPIQLVEAAALMIIALIIFTVQIRTDLNCTIEMYLFLYGVVRFFLEFLRYDSLRGHLSELSTSQWISILMIVSAIISYKIQFSSKAVRAEN
ncbi:phosphatidylglycerol:prolipoprotein diacylglycerol transferase [Oribacterium sp. KHPX15]|uniref:prolipoprotein diacylglyceryl transferase n=1 Tax=unclassified Oribacterium TaxID=2629782 RepID=UPI0004E1DE78|nr:MULTISPECIES: prolipoprotein diacylglyceryl transferase family protein [unclassified Oribacterium]SDZ95367.1 phosphatidylglycerol:prolipoprotein diacylglycerol transferase [Oribacterium sp. KHPX15]